LQVLITGGNSYLGASIADKFIKENHEVSVIDPSIKSSEYNNTAENTRQKQKFYNLKTTDKECEKIFDANTFDAVIYISESLKSHNLWNGSGNGKYEDNNCITGLINIRNLSAEKKVKKFIFISSAAIYGNTGNISAATEESETVITGLDGVGDLLSEYYCNKFSQSSKLNTIILRISNFYGPGQQPENSNGNKNYFDISSIINDIVGDRVVEVNISNRKTYDFIYIEDAVEAIFKVAVDNCIKGVFNISSNTETTFDSLMDIISGIKKPRKLILKDSQKSMQVNRSWIDNTKIKNQIEWSPEVDLQEGIRKTFDWQTEKAKDKKKKSAIAVKKAEASEKSKQKPAGKKILTIVENLLLFLIFAFLQYGELFFNIKLPAISIDFMIIYIILVGILWGQVQAYIAMILASVIFIGASFFAGVDIITFLYTPSNLVLLALYLLVGIITGYAIEKKNREITSQTVAYAGLTDKYMFLLNIYNQTRSVKNELENQVIDTEDSFSAIYKTIQEVDSLEIERVFTGAIGAIERIMKTDKVSIYITGSNGNKDFLRLKARSLALSDKIQNSIKISESPYLREVISKKRMYVNRSLEAGVPVMVSPVKDGSEVLAIISIHDTGFENLTANYENLFQAVTGLVSNAVKRAYFFEKSLTDKRYLPDTKILISEVFEKVLTEVRRNMDELGMSYALLRVMDDEKNHIEISNRITSGIRENDYIGISKNNNIYILLSNTNNNYAGLVVERLGEKGVKCELVEEEMFNEY
jgi:nucleoside-diphosphate-sugar epimerase